MDEEAAFRVGTEVETRARACERSKGIVENRTRKIYDANHPARNEDQVPSTLSRSTRPLKPLVPSENSTWWNIDRKRTEIDHPRNS